MASSEATINEVDFCAQIASAVNGHVSQNPTVYPFTEARIEGLHGKGRSKRKDLRFFGHNDKLVLCGEVKLPGTREGQSPYAEGLRKDAEAKASDAGVQFFFTWNVNTFVLWDRLSPKELPLDRRVCEWRLPRYLSDAPAGPAN